MERILFGAGVGIAMAAIQGILDTNVLYTGVLGVGITIAGLSFADMTKKG